MNRIFPTSIVLATLLFSTACSVFDNQRSVRASAPIATTNSNAAAIHAAQQCMEALAQTAAVNISELDSTEIDILIWNIRKGEMRNWREDLDALAADKDLLLIQEASLSMQSENIFGQNGFWSFAPGYSSGDTVTGVATLSLAEPLGHCHLTAYEPWIGTPKATNITQYALSDSNRTLLVVNTHMINFTMGLKEFRAQLAPVIEVLAAHNGPVIFSGDFNTWRPARYRALKDLMSDLSLVAIEFEEDHRVRIFGSVVDHVFVGGLHVRAANTHRLESSDHNPMSIRLSL